MASKRWGVLVIGCGATALGAALVLRRSLRPTSAVDQGSPRNSFSAHLAPAAYWEQRYAGSDRVWSGRVNRVLADIAPSLPVGRALDLGCGEGADAIWLAQQGWSVTGIDISPSAIRRAAKAADDHGIAEDRITFTAGDLATLAEPGKYALVTASFLQSPVELARTEILRAAAGCVNSGGHLLITSHVSGPPSGAHPPGGPGPRFLTPDEEVAALGLEPNEWTVQLAQIRPRDIVDPHGNHASLDDSVVLFRRH